MNTQPTTSAPHTRRSSVYTLRVRQADAGKLSALRTAIEQRVRVSDTGALTVSFRVSDDAAALDLADAATAGLVSHYSVSTGLGVHRRTVPMIDSDQCGHVDSVTARVCTRGLGHPGSHTDEPNGAEW